MSASTLLAADIPNEAALALGPTIGWLTFTGLLLALAVIFVDRERWRRFWLRTEDPRSLGAFRIAFSIVLLLNINNMWQHFDFLFTDEGLYLSDSARQYIAGGQFKGYGSGGLGDPRGFFDFAAVVEWAKGPRYSLLYFWDSPSFFWAYIAVFELATLSFLLGFRTRLSGWVSLILTLGLMNRSPIYQSGADVVFRVMFIYLVFSRCGHAFSIDNWLRVRRLRREGRLDERDGPGKGGGAVVEDEHGQPKLLEAFYRRIPAWPRMLMIFQLATIYFWTGCAKTGSVWAKGDSLYYALNLDHFSRVPTQYYGYMFGTSVFRLMTWTVHFWQIGFPLVVLGLIVRWARREGLEPPTGWRRWALRGAWTGLGLIALAIVWVGLPVHVSADAKVDVGTIRLLVAGGWLALMAGVGWGWWRLRERPFAFTIRGHELRLDLETFFTLFTGRRFWLTLGLVFHLHIMVLMNIGMFAPVMMVVYIVCLNGTEVAIIVRRIGKALADLGVPGIPAWVARGEMITPTEAEGLPVPNQHRDIRELPSMIVLASFAFGVAAILAKVQGRGWWWMVFALAVALPVSTALVQRLRGGPEGKVPSEDAKPWTYAYGWFGRAFIPTFVFLHIAAVAASSIPDKDCTKSFRSPARAVATPWMHVTQTHQSWNMFAPNPTRTNVFMKVFVTDQQGELWDLYTDANSPRNKQEPWFIYDRMGKITRRVTGKGKHYQKWVARYHCRQWALEHDGELPEKVEIIKQWYAIPSPQKMRKIGPYTPEEYLAKHGHQKKVYTAHCAREADGQPTNELRRRHGLPEVEESKIRAAAKPRYDRWTKRNEAASRKRTAAGRKQAKAKLRELKAQERTRTR
ncbi:hypothetical protein G6O69_35055 [Pseudenhygromyxa sp. WMMC2535]|uniref:hypothetical protein n=1 Tax=Pseudenhygromyxa sp. WMMC2535 TaxID=2712867 RepID=UPI00155727B1|nr:hypothetical protein [Pseudenhygromyxa sp. WMMC2535]NVB43095.1 hypothetical protein [Pseudenhygromyxa sp. WMMC2535]